MNPAALLPEDCNLLSSNFDATKDSDGSCQGLHSRYCSGPTPHASVMEEVAVVGNEGSRPLPLFMAAAPPPTSYLTNMLIKSHQIPTVQQSRLGHTVWWAPLPQVDQKAKMCLWGLECIIEQHTYKKLDIFVFVEAPNYTKLSHLNLDTYPQKASTMVDEVDQPSGAHGRIGQKRIPL